MQNVPGNRPVTPAQLRQTSSTEASPGSPWTHEFSQRLSPISVRAILNHPDLPQAVRDLLVANIEPSDTIGLANCVLWIARCGEVGALTYLLNNTQQGYLLFDGSGGGNLADATLKCLLNALAETTRISTFHLKKLPLDSQKASALGDMLKRNASITSLKLQHVELKDKHLSILMPRLACHGNLTRLQLDHNQLSTEGAREIAGQLRYLPRLETLSLSFNEDLGDEGAIILARELEANETLLSLNLSYTAVGEAGAHALGDMLAGNSILTSLDVFGCPVGSYGAVVLAGGVKSSTSLQALRLGGNNGHATIGDPGALSLAAALQVNTSLKKLSLTFCRVGDQGAAAISRALRLNRSLLDLDLSYNNINLPGGKAIASALRNNNSLIRLHLGTLYAGPDGVNLWRSIAPKLYQNEFEAQLAVV